MRQLGVMPVVTQPPFIPSESRDEGASDLGRRVLASRGIAPVRPQPMRPPEPGAGFVLGVATVVVIVSVLALVGAAALVWGVVTWLKGLAW